MTRSRTPPGYRLLAAIAALAGVLLFLSPCGVCSAALPVAAGSTGLVVPAGFTANVFAEGLSAPRFLEFGPDGRLYVAESGKDRIVSLGDSTGDGVADGTRVFATGLASAHSVTWRDGACYAGVTNGVVVLRDTDSDGAADARKVLIDNYPTSGHGTRTVLFLKDGRMVVSVGSSCNVCEERDKRRGAIVVYDAPAASGDGGASGERIFAKGLRNAVGLALHPETGELWSTNNGRDWMGDDVPPDTIQVVREGDDFGWPRCHAGDVVDPEFGGQSGCTGVAAPAVKLQAHSAPLGLAFYTGSSFPAEYRGDLFVALHGSWNRTVPTGFKVVRVDWKDGKPSGPAADFVTGFRDPSGDRVLGRPVGLAVGPDGALYVSDDKGGFIYRVAYSR